jgi:uncharacterized protein
MSDLRIDVADLLRHPGARRVLRRSAAVDGLGTPTARVVGPVELDLVLERVSEGIVVRGTIGARFEAECGICLRDIASGVDAAVSELYEEHPVDGETYLLLGHVVDLEQLVRDAVLLELPLAPTCAAADGDACSPEPVAGDLDDDADASVDPRWAALSELEL